MNKLTVHQKFSPIKKKNPTVDKHIKNRLKQFRQRIKMVSLKKTKTKIFPHVQEEEFCLCYYR